MPWYNLLSSFSVPCGRIRQGGAGGVPSGARLFLRRHVPASAAPRTGLPAGDPCCPAGLPLWMEGNPAKCGLICSPSCSPRQSKRGQPAGWPQHSREHAATAAGLVWAAAGSRAAGCQGEWPAIPSTPGYSLYLHPCTGQLVTTSTSVPYDSILVQYVLIIQDVFVTYIV